MSIAHGVVPGLMVGVQVSGVKNLKIIRMMVCQVDEGPPQFGGRRNSFVKARGRVMGHVLCEIKRGRKDFYQFKIEGGLWALFGITH